MASDPEPTSALISQLLGLLGIGASGGAVVKQMYDKGAFEERVSGHTREIDDVKKTLGVHSTKMDHMEQTLTRLDERSERAESDRQEMLHILRTRP